MNSTPPLRNTRSSADLVADALKLHEQGLLAEAQALYEQVLSVDPLYFDALHLLGVLFFQEGESTKALDLLLKATDINPHHAPAFNNLGNTLLAAGSTSAALASYDKAIEISPRYPEAHLNRGNALQDLGDLPGALTSYNRSIELEPINPDALSNRGALFREIGDHMQALESFNQALTLKPYSVETHINKGHTQRVLKNIDCALESFTQALAINPTSNDALNGYACTLCDLGRHAESLQSLEMALRSNPSNPQTHVNIALIQLALGELSRGWEEYEWRLKIPAPIGERKTCSGSLWSGKEPLQGKTILVRCEQGLGDTIQFCRYIKQLSGLGALVALEVQPSLAPLLHSLTGIHSIIPEGAELPHHDYYCSLLSLPYCFGTTLDSIPSSAGYICSHPTAQARWQEKLGPRHTLRIGISWSGSSDHPNDHYRSISLCELLASLPAGPQYVSLQREVRASDHDALASRVDLRHFGRDLIDFSDTAALCDLMDLVISIDSCVVHLAGAMNKPLLLLLPFNADWRWLLNRQDSPWYPSATIVRQQALGDWTRALQEASNVIVRLLQDERK